MTEEKNNNKSKQVKKRRLKGVIVSDKMEKTVVVKVTRLKQHPKYKKYFRVSKRFKAHTDSNKYKVGDMVIIEETRPLSKEKRWRVISLVSSASNEDKENKENNNLSNKNENV